MANTLLSLANEHQHTIYHHPKAFKDDYGSIKDPVKRSWRQKIASTVPALPSPPAIQDEILDSFGTPEDGSNHWADYHHLAAVLGHAVSMLVTEDKQLIKRARRLGLGEKVSTADDAIAAIRARASKPAYEPLMPRVIYAHDLDPKDPIFRSLREDYAPKFDDWFRQRQLEHRRGYALKSGSKLIAVTILKDETPAEYDLPGKMLKICLFKVSDDYAGMRYGELLLKSVFDYAYENKYESIYLTAFEKHARVITFMSEYGFQDSGKRTPLGEVVLWKQLNPDDASGEVFDFCDYHRLYGPRHYRMDALRYIVPIEPKFHRLLFPELDEQIAIPEVGFMSAAGNAIDKAYLCASNVKDIPPGSILYFYRSMDSDLSLTRRLTIVGIVQGVKRSKSASDIMDYVGKRTVYREEQVNEITADGQRECLAILFRQAKRIPQCVASSKQLNEAEIWRKPPQSIMNVKDSAVNWLMREIDMV